MNSFTLLGRRLVIQFYFRSFGEMKGFTNRDDGMGLNFLITFNKSNNHTQFVFFKFMAPYFANCRIIVLVLSNTINFKKITRFPTFNLIASNSVAV